MYGDDFVIILSEQIVSWNDLGGDPAPIFEKLRENSPLIVFQENLPKFVLLSMEEYESLISRSDSHQNRRSPAGIPGEKIGSFIRRTMQRLFAGHVLSQNEIYQLCDQDYCRRVLHQTFPVLKRYDPRRPLSEQKKVNGYSRYYDLILSQEGEQFLLSNHWIETKRPAFLAWLNGR